MTAKKTKTTKHVLHVALPMDVFLALNNKASANGSQATPYARQLIYRHLGLTTPTPVPKPPLGQICPGNPHHVLPLVPLKKN